MKKCHKNFCRALLYAVLPLVLAAVVIPNFQKAGWTTSGVPFVFDVRVIDAETDEPVIGAGVLVYFDTSWPISTNSSDVNSATTDASGRCQVKSHFPGHGRKLYFHGGGRSGQGRLTIDKNVFVRAAGYDDWEAPCESILGKFLEITTGPSVSVEHTLNLSLRRKPESMLSRTTLDVAARDRRSPQP